MDANLEMIMENETNWNGNDTAPSPPSAMAEWMLAIILLYIIVCCFGIVANGLVIYAIVSSSKTVKVTNIYILNLAISDLLYLAGIPFTVVAAIERMWVLGEVMCKIFYILTSVNWFTSVYTLTTLSADRYIAICHPFWSIPYRTPLVARVVCIVVWVLSLFVMLPIIVYSRAIEGDGRVSCTVEWPRGSLGIDPSHAFFWYSFSLGFALPLGLIILFYSLVVLRLKGVGPKRNLTTKSSRSQQAQAKVTVMVTTVVVVNIVCWLPYWIFQLLLLVLADEDLPLWVILAYQLVTVVNYTNSAINPVLYGFLSDSFCKSLHLAFARCRSGGPEPFGGMTSDGRNGSCSRGGRRTGDLVRKGQLEMGTTEEGARTCSVVLVSDVVKMSQMSRQPSDEMESKRELENSTFPVDGIEMKTVTGEREY